ncbi:MAG TPA: TetR family transcriptional regulator, partial [Marmoricola sp.]|nr:TetR family transcriptional regulator [Marmoricola sp.]
LKLRDRLIATAREVTTKAGWASVTMAKVGNLAGVSRQTVYSLFGDKKQLAEALVMSELMSFLEIVDDAFQPLPEKLHEGVLVAGRGCLEFAEQSPLVREIVGGAPGLESELLALITTDSSLIRRTAAERLFAHASSYDLGMTEEHLHTLCDMAVRLTLSMIQSPDGTPAEMAEQIAWFAERVTS